MEIAPKGFKIIGYSNQRNVLNLINVKDDRLTANHRYSIHFKPMHMDAFVIEFTTPLEPFYSNVKRVRMDTGDLLQHLSDEEIGRYIYDNSKEVAFVKCDEDDEDEDVDYDHYMGLWVRYKTVIDVIQAAYVTRSMQAGVDERRIGDMTINKEVTLPLIDDMLKRFGRKLTEAEEILKGVAVPVGAFVKAGNNYEYTERGTF